MIGPGPPGFGGGGFYGGLAFPDPGAHPPGIIGPAPPQPAMGVPAGSGLPLQAPQPQVLYQLPPGNLPMRQEPPPVHRPTGSFWQPSLFGCFHDQFSNCQGRCSHILPCIFTWDDNQCDAGAVDAWEMTLSTGECLVVAASCCWTPVKFGENHKQMHPEGMGCCLAGMLYTCAFCCLGKNLRRDIRVKYGLNAGPADLCVHCFCSPCGVHQEMIELRHQKTIGRL